MDDIRLNYVYHGDALRILRQFPDQYFDAVITDPPFGIGKKYRGKEEHSNEPEGYWKWLRPRYKQMLRVLKKGGLFAMWQSQPYMQYYWDWFGNDIHIYAACKNFIQIRKTAIQYAYDPIILFYKKGHTARSPIWNKRKGMRNLDFFVANTARFVAQTKSLAKQHPYPRPIDQAEEIVKNFVATNGIVLDCFMGSGTTAVACLRHGRSFVGVELSKKYVELSQKRIKALE